MKRLILPFALCAVFFSCGDIYPEIVSAEYTGPSSCKVVYSGEPDSDTVFLVDGMDQRYTALETSSSSAGFWSGKTEVVLKITPDFRPGDRITVTASGSMSGSAYFDVPDDL